MPTPQNSLTSYFKLGSCSKGQQNLVDLKQAQRISLLDLSDFYTFTHLAGSEATCKFQKFKYTPSSQPATLISTAVSLQTPTYTTGVTYKWSAWVAWSCSSSLADGLDFHQWNLHTTSLSLFTRKSVFMDHSNIIMDLKSNIHTHTIGPLPSCKLRPWVFPRAGLLTGYSSFRFTGYSCSHKQ